MPWAARMSATAQVLADFAPTIQKTLDAVGADLTREEAVVLLDALRDCIRELRVLDDHLVGVIVETGRAWKFDVPGAGHVEIHKKTDRKAWDRDRLFPVLASRFADESLLFCDENGEKLPRAETCLRIFHRLGECISLRDGKVTGLRPLGIERDDFCTTSDAGYSVQITK
jgi:hypothetical protein